MSCAEMMAALKIRGMTHCEKLVYVAMVGLSADAEGLCKISFTDLAELLDIRRQTAVAIIHALVAKRLVSVELEGKGTRAAHYRVIMPDDLPKPPDEIADPGPSPTEPVEAASGHSTEPLDSGHLSEPLEPTGHPTEPLAYSGHPSEPLASSHVTEPLAPSGHPSEPLDHESSRARVDSESLSFLTESVSSSFSTTIEPSVDSGGHKQKKTRAKRGTQPTTPIPDDWRPTQEGEAMARVYHVPRSEVARFIAYHQGRGNLRANWNACWATWCMNYESYGRRPQRTDPSRDHLCGMVMG